MPTSDHARMTRITQTYDDVMEKWVPQLWGYPLFCGIMRTLLPGDRRDPKPSRHAPAPTVRRPVRISSTTAERSDA